MKLSAKKLTLSMTTTVLLALACSQAQAQDGSRLCGYITVNSPTKIGFLYEAHTGDDTYSKQCDDAISKAMGSIINNPQLKSMQWEKVQKYTCQYVANEGFINYGENPDICSSMESKYLYKVTKQGEAKATYEKQ
jgi:hypothetical protein